MPRRGYRKGVDDRKEPLTRQVYTRVSVAAHLVVAEEARSRGMTASKLIRQILESHAAGRRAQLPPPRGLTNQFLREFNRAGNNLNQLARQANHGLVTVSENELRHTLKTLTDLARRVAG